MDEKEITKMVSFRLGVDQYTKLEELRSSEGARSVSAMFRRAVDRLIQDTTAKIAAKDDLTFRVTRLEKRVDSLTLDVRKLKKNSLT
jgi:Arc/MetJ-type ribon-helix-helix transcriptional regulator